MSESTLPPISPRSSNMGPLFSFVGLCVVSMLAFMGGAAAGLDSWDMAILGLALLTGFVGFLPVIVDQARPPERRQVFITLLMLSYMVHLVLPIFTQYFGSEGTGGMMDFKSIAPWDVAAGQGVTLVGLIMMLLGFYMPVGKGLASMAPKPRYDWSPNAALGVALIMIPLGWTVFLGGQFGLIPKRAGSGVLGQLASAVFYGIALLTIVYIRYRLRSALLLLLLLIPPTMAFNFFTGSKRLFLTALAMVAIPYIVHDRRIRTSWVVAGVATLVVLYPVAQFYREVVQRGYTLTSIEVLSNPGRALGAIAAFTSGVDPLEYLKVGFQATGHRLNALTLPCIIVRDTPDVVPYQGGWSIGYVFLSYIPRVLWPGKPDTTIGQWITDNYGAGPHIKSNTGPSWIGEFYFNFGYPGVIVGMLVMGLFFRVLQEICFQPSAAIPFLLIAVVVLYEVARSPQSGLIQPINGVIFAIPPIMAAHFMVRTLGGAVPLHRNTGS